MERVILKIVDYTNDPGPRYKRQDLPGEKTSGEEYYVTVLNNVFADCIRENKELELYLDEVSGYPSSFLDEAIGELVYDFTKNVVETHLRFSTMMFKRRVKQVLEETYPQWDERRKNHEVIVHSNEIVAKLFRLNAKNELEEYSVNGAI